MKEVKTAPCYKYELMRDALATFIIEKYIHG